jgi:hypothetical protein
VDEDDEAYGSLKVVPKLGEAVATKGRHQKPRHLKAMIGAFAEAIASEAAETRKIMGDGPMCRVVRLSIVRDHFRSRYVTGETTDKASSAVRTAFMRAVRELDRIELCSGSWQDEEWIWNLSQASQVSQSDEGDGGE